MRKETFIQNTDEMGLDDLTNLCINDKMTINDKMWILSLQSNQNQESTMYKNILLSLLLCIVFTSKFGRSEIYNVNRRKAGDDHKALQMFGKLWLTR